MSEKETSKEIASIAGRVLATHVDPVLLTIGVYQGLLRDAKTLAASCLSQREVDPPASHAFGALKALIQADADYAWGWHCNIAGAIMDSADDDHKSANETAAHMMSHLFGYDITAHPNYAYGKSGAQAYAELRIAAENAEPVHFEDDGIEIEFSVGGGFSFLPGGQAGYVKLARDTGCDADGTRETAEFPIETVTAALAGLFVGLKL